MEDKITKLFNLATSSEPHEAKSAQFMALKLMAEHKISFQDLEASISVGMFNHNMPVTEKPTRKDGTAWPKVPRSLKPTLDKLNKYTKERVTKKALTSDRPIHIQVYAMGCSFWEAGYSEELTIRYLSLILPEHKEVIEKSVPAAFSRKYAQT